MRFIYFLNQYSQRKVEKVGASYLIFGIFGVLNYPLSYLYHINYAPANYENLFFRIVATILCLFLALEKYWPIKIKRYLPLYWHFTVMFCLPFFGSFMLLKNHISASWLMNSVLGFFLLVIIIDWLSFMMITIIGIILGYLVFDILYDNNLIVKANTTDIIQALYMYFFAIVIGGIFSNNKDKIYQQKLDTLRALSGTIAHEMRTPLSSISAYTYLLERAVPKLKESYNLAKQQNLPLPEIEDIELASISQVADNINKLNKNALLTIDMLLAKVNESVEHKELSECRIKDSINKVLVEYPLNDEQRKLITVDIKKDFVFLGNERLFMHVIFNLLKNCLYYINMVNKGNITISTFSNEKNNILIFKDTGKGISKNELPHIFDKFYTNSNFGTGLGLPFCKLVIESAKGNIKCNSVEGEFAEFIISFPKMK